MTGRAGWMVVATVMVVLMFPAVVQAEKTQEINQYGITWTFAEEAEFGHFANGDYWVVGPVALVKISNSWHMHGFEPGPNKDGSMINPGADGRQGYDGSLGSYRAESNAALPNGKPVSAENPLVLKPGSSLVSTVSWLYESREKTEPGCPRFNGGTKTPRPVLRDGAILTCLAEAPPKGSFRPPYCGGDKTVKFNVSQLKRDRLPKLTPVEGVPSVAKMERGFQRPWIDHVHQYSGAMFHPSSNMPQYGRDMSTAMGQAALMLLLDFEKLPDSPSRDTLLVYVVQLGIDLAGIADAGGGWPANGGHHMGRKWPILFAGVMLDDKHMAGVGRWKTVFQENDNTFTVSQADITMTHSDRWSPDKRAPKSPYEAEHIGLPEWGIRHVPDPEADNLHWKAIYRSINNMAYPGFVLAAHIMGQKKAWNHDVLFDYIDRAVANSRQTHPPGTKARGHYVYGGDFVMNMWRTYRADYGCRWVPADPSSLYSKGALDCSKCKHHCPNKPQKIDEEAPAP
jgi:hypothetical protein